MIFPVGYSESDIKRFRKVSEQLNINLVLNYTAAGLINYLNSKSMSELDLTRERIGDKITAITVFSHGLPNTFEFSYGQEPLDESLGSFGLVDVQYFLEPAAFDRAVIDLYSCGSAFPGETKSLAETLAEHAKSIVSGYTGESSYNFRHLNPDEGFGDWLDRFPRGFDPDGSEGYPGPGGGSGALGTYDESRWVVFDRRR
jgi:hypothetical protein